MIIPPQHVKRTLAGLASVMLLSWLALDVTADQAFQLDESPITDDDRDHWAFRPLVRAAPPVVADDRWSATTIDRFTLDAMRRMELEPMPQAGRATLIRRLHFDLIGLPPRPDEILRFVSDQRPDAYERLVDQLLASPAYGERWGQYWLDLARFAETDGFEHDKVRPNAWRYRDWVIAALNEDLPYDQFVQWQIAGDLAGSRDSQIATGFALCGPDMPDINDQNERRHFVLNELTATVGSVFLGLQLGCAQCHDHKYDPISQADFYRLRAFFDSTVIFTDHPLQSDAGTKEAKNAKGRVLQERAGRKPVSHFMIAGDHRRPGPVVEPDFVRVANSAGDSVRKPQRGDVASEYRMQLARWLTQTSQPLTGRVIVNRLWQHHFGEGLVRTPSDFGIMGDEPWHPELLDWLATELMRSHWSLKKLQRQIVMSSTYRQASRPQDSSWSEEQARAARERWSRSLKRDPANRYLARQTRRRLDAEAIRDAVLGCSGQLSQLRGGPGVMPPLPSEIRKSIRRDHWTVSPHAEDHRRRSVYLFVRRNLRYPFLDVFDRPDASFSCGRRTVSNTAPQSLAMLNSDLTTQAARDLAESLLRKEMSLETRIQQLYLRTLGRPPEPAETKLAAQFVQAYIQRNADSADAELQVQHSALTQLSLALLNLNEFIYID